MSTEIKSGDSFGQRYVVEDYIDEGGMQYVFKANDTTFNRSVALKTPKVSSASKRFKRSAQTAAKVNHPNVAKTLDYFVEGERQFLVEEFVEGPNLNKCLLQRFGKADPSLSAYIIHHLAKGIRASHTAGIMHRDLKPSNIMVEGGERFLEIKVTDFGIAKLAQEEIDEAVEGGSETITGSQTVLGALPYMAPETMQAQNKKSNITQAVDIWSAGAILFELLSGSKPFGQGLPAVHNIISNNISEYPKHLLKNKQFEFLNRQLMDIVSICLNQDAKSRPTAQQLVDECEKLCYPEIIRESGLIRSKQFKYGFIAAQTSWHDVFFHQDSVYGIEWDKLKAGDKVWFSKFPAEPADRAHPVLRYLE